IVKRPFESALVGSLEGSHGGRHSVMNDALTGEPYTTLKDATIGCDSGGMMVGLADIDAKKQVEFYRPVSVVHSSTRQAPRGFLRSHPRYTVPP
ncbi:hypothetical protein, partial [Auritidibacter ignavus]|uniref:hypothetical protein n=1 Tax=Auritidibacter ignavus TaxID=678932 RepID=UPI001CB6F171